MGTKEGMGQKCRKNVDPKRLFPEERWHNFFSYYQHFEFTRSLFLVVKNFYHPLVAMGGEVGSSEWELGKWSFRNRHHRIPTLRGSIERPPKGAIEL